MKGEGEALLQEHLAQVEENMRRSGLSKEDIEVVLDALGEQIEEDRLALSPGALSARDARKILASMAPPGSYAEDIAMEPSRPEPPSPAPAMVWLGRLSAGLCVGTLVMVVVITLVGSATKTDMEELGGATLVMGLAAAITSGAVARATPEGRFGLIGGGTILALCLVMSQI